MKTWQFLSSTAIAATIFPLMVGSAQAAVVLTIDPFTAPRTPPLQAASGNTVNNPNTPFLANFVEDDFGSSLLASSTARDITLNITQTGGNFANVTIGGGSLNVSNGTGVKSNSIFDYTGFSNVDFSTGGADRFLFNVSASNFPASVGVNINGTVRSIPVSASASPQTLELLYSAFPSFVNLTLVNAFAFNIDTPGGANGGGNLSLSSVATGQGDINPPLPPATEIPEPASVLGILTIGALGGLSKLKNKKRG